MHVNHFYTNKYLHKLNPPFVVILEKALNAITLIVKLWIILEMRIITIILKVLFKITIVVSA